MYSDIKMLLVLPFTFSFYLGRKVLVGLQEWHLWEQCVQGAMQAGLMWYIFVLDIHCWPSALGECQAFLDSILPSLILKTIVMRDNVEVIDELFL